MSASCPFWFKRCCFVTTLTWSSSLCLCSRMWVWTPSRPAGGGGRWAWPRWATGTWCPSRWPGSWRRAAAFWAAPWWWRCPSPSSSTSSPTSTGDRKLWRRRWGTTTAGRWDWAARRSPRRTRRTRTRGRTGTAGVWTTTTSMISTMTMSTTRTTEAWSITATWSIHRTRRYWRWKSCVSCDELDHRPDWNQSDAFSSRLIVKLTLSDPTPLRSGVSRQTGLLILWLSSTSEDSEPSRQQTE